MFSKTKWKNRIVLGLLPVAISGCDLLDDEVLNSGFIPDVRAVVATAAGDYSSGAISVISGDNNRIATNGLLAGSSNIKVETYGANAYVFNRGSGSITKVDASYPDDVIWEYSTNDSPVDTTSNPSSLVFVNETKAYLLRYGSGVAWIVNPSATTENEFKTGELDLSNLADADGIPEMYTGISAGDRAYITLQRLDRDTPYWDANNTAYVAVVDINTDQLVDTDLATAGLQAVSLTIRNPNADIQYIAAENAIYVQGVGSYGGDASINGGIERIDITDYSTSMVIDASDDVTYPFADVSGMSLVSSTLGYFIAYAGWGDNTLYRFNPQDAANTFAVTSVSNVISTSVAFVAADSGGNVWVGNSTDASVYIIDAATDSLSDTVSTQLNPISIGFVQ